MRQKSLQLLPDSLRGKRRFRANTLTHDTQRNLRWGSGKCCPKNRAPHARVGCFSGQVRSSDACVPLLPDSIEPATTEQQIHAVSHRLHGDTERSGGREGESVRDHRNGKRRALPIVLFAVKTADHLKSRAQGRLVVAANARCGSSSSANDSCVVLVPCKR